MATFFSIQKKQEISKKIINEISNYFQINLLEFIKTKLPKDITNITPFFVNCLDDCKTRLELELQDDNRFSNIAKNNIQKIINLVYRYYFKLSQKFTKNE